MDRVHMCVCVWGVVEEYFSKPPNCSSKSLRKYNDPKHSEEEINEKEIFTPGSGRQF